MCGGRGISRARGRHADAAARPAFMCLCLSPSWPRRLQRLEGIVRAIGQSHGVDAASVGEASRAVAQLRQGLQEMQQGQVGGRRGGEVQRRAWP